MLAGFFSRQGTPAAKLPADVQAWPSPVTRVARQPSSSPAAVDETRRRSGSARDEHREADHQPSASREPSATPTRHTPVPSDTREEMAERGPAMREQSGDESPGDEREYAFKRFVEHRWVGDSLEIQVEWQQGEPTWEPETNLHADALQSLLQYWASRGGRPTNPADPDMFQIFAVRRQSPDRKRLLVEWVGYSPKEASWVLRRVVEETAPEVVAEYLKTRRPGRPKTRQKKKKKNNGR